MEGSKSIDVIIENYNTGQKKGRIFSYVITLTVTVGILFTVFFGINLISEKYFLIQQTMAQQLESKTIEVINMQKVNQDLTHDLDKLKIENSAFIVENATFIKKLEESKKETEMLWDKYKIIQKENKSLEITNKNLENAITKLKKVYFGTSVSSVSIDKKNQKTELK